MKPLIFIPPAQAEALFDAYEGGEGEERLLGDRLAPLPWLDEDGPEEIVLFRAASRASEEEEHAFSLHFSQGCRAA